jgi:hypothetical protein
MRTGGISARRNPITTGFTFVLDGKYVWQNASIPWDKAISTAGAMADGAASEWRSMLDAAKRAGGKFKVKFPYSMLIEERTGGERIEIDLRTGKRVSPRQTPSTRKNLEIKLKAVLTRPSVSGDRERISSEERGLVPRERGLASKERGLAHPIPKMAPGGAFTMKAPARMSSLRKMMMKVARAPVGKPESAGAPTGEIVERAGRFLVVGTDKWFASRGKAKLWIAKHR